MNVAFQQVQATYPLTTRVPSSPVRIQQKPTGQFLPYLQTYRAVAAIFVVAIHCPYLMQQETQLGFATILFTRSTLLFVFLSGFVFQHVTARKFNARAYYVSKLKYVVTPYLLLSFTYLLYKLLLTKTMPGISSAGLALLDGSVLLPYWFIPMMGLFYLVAPLLVRLDKNGWLYCALPALISVSLVVTRQVVGTNDTLGLFTHFFSVYVLGMYCSRHKAQVYAITGLAKHYLLGAFLALVALSYCQPELLAEQVQYAQKLVLALLLLYAFQRYDAYVPAWVKTLGDRSFGIYFLHFFPLLLVQHVLVSVIHDNKLVNTNFYYAMLLLVIVGITSVAIAAIKLVTGRYSRYLIGC
jgi:peptidoglycan/LPS O-acetylase OafA/YrhL